MVRRESMIKGLIDVPKEEAILLLEAGDLLMELGQFDSAYDIFNGVAELVPHSDIPCVALGNLYFSQGQLDKALKEHRRALKRDGQSSYAYAHVGEILFFQKKFQQGIAALKKAIEIDPRGVPAQFAKELLKAYEQKAFTP